MSKVITASTVRNYFREDAKRMESLPEAARASVAEGARGRLHPEVIQVVHRQACQGASLHRGRQRQGQGAGRGQPQGAR